MKSDIYQLNLQKQHQTRNMGQSPTWGKPAPQVQLEI